MVDEERIPRKIALPGVRSAMRNVRSRLSSVTHREVVAVWDKVRLRLIFDFIYVFFCNSICCTLSGFLILAGDARGCEP